MSLTTANMISDLDALLAELQTSIPQSPTSQTPAPPNYQRQTPEPYTTQNNGLANAPPPSHQHTSREQQQTQNVQQKTTYKQQQQTIETEPRYSNGEVENPRANFQPSSKKVYYQESKEETRTETRSSGPTLALPGQDRELQSLLSELNSSSYTSATERTTTSQRPTVDSLLNELNSASSSQHESSRITQQNHVSHGTQQPISASTATKDLDNLMAELSDFKQNDKLRSPALVRKFLDRNDTYAKPEKPKSPSPPQPAPPPPKEPSPPVANELDCMLGSLADHMTEQGVTTTQKGCCCACDKPIVGQVITALGKTWHPEHFSCAHCNQELGSKNFFERDSRPYCESCYHELFSPRCAYCDGSILDKCVTALDKNWHPDHFFCAQCGNTFGEEGFHEKDGKAYCREDYYNMFAPKCGGCNSPIMENYISALNAQWHPECFVCRDCRKPFNGGSFFDHEGLPYCENHYHAKRGSLCAGCHKPITGRCITAMFRKYHPEHFTCSFCMKQLNKGTFKEQNDKPYCHVCFEKLFG